VTAQTLTLISGIVLLLLVALVGWNLRKSQQRFEASRQRPDEGDHEEDPG
jgi:lipopolysaccharide export system protein LptC